MKATAQPVAGERPYLAVRRRQPTGSDEICGESWARSLRSDPAADSGETGTEAGEQS